MRRAIAAVVAAGVLVLGGCVLGGCGGAESTPAPAVPPAASTAVAPAAQAYVDAVGRQDLDGLVSAFAADGVVVDVSRRIEGRDAIRTWADREVIGGSLRVDGVTEVEPGVQRLRVHWAPGGSGGWAADYTFTVDGDGIAEADLQYAR
jgi:hypothetical protein